MTYFKIPKNITKILRISRGIFGGGFNKDKKNHLYLKNWKVMTLLKRLGGLGIKDMEKHNDALLARVALKLLEENNP